MKVKHFLISFSYIFHPIFISIYGALLYFYVSINFEKTLLFGLINLQILILTTLLPLSFHWLLFSLKKIKKFTEASISERRWPIFMQIVFILLLLKFSLINQYYPELYLFFVGGLISAVLVFILVLFKFKASLHLLGCSSLLVFVYFISAFYQNYNILLIITLTLCLGFVASSRLVMKAHNYKELIVGMLIGVLPQILVWFYKI